MKALKFKPMAIAALCAVMFVACNKDNEKGGEKRDPVQLSTFSATIPNGELDTRTSLTTEGELQFAAADAIGLFLRTGNTLVETNRKFVTNDGGALASFKMEEADQTANGIIYWPDVAVDFYAYYPYDASKQDPTAIPFELETNQTNNSTGLTASDFVYASLESPSPMSTVSLGFKHAFSKLIFKLKPGRGFVTKKNGVVTYDNAAFVEAMKDAAITLHNFKQNESVNITTGAVTLSSDLLPIDANGKFEKEGVSIVSAADPVSIELKGVSAIVTPQTIGAEQIFIELATTSKYYFKAQKATGNTFAGNTSYVITLTVNKSSSGEIDPGTPTDPDFPTEDNNFAIDAYIGKWISGATVSGNIDQKLANAYVIKGLETTPKSATTWSYQYGDVPMVTVAFDGTDWTATPITGNALNLDADQVTSLQAGSARIYCMKIGGVYQLKYLETTAIPSAINPIDAGFEEGGNVVWINGEVELKNK